MREGPIRILLIEDEALNRALVRATLTRAEDPRLRDAELTEAPTIADGQQALQAGTFDVLLLDVRLPDGNGLDLASGLPEPRPIMVAMTASVVPSPREAAMKAGCDGFLEKPFQPHDLQGVLTRLLDRLVPA
jgi:two-component system KDP operon response regulator KdpE